MIKQKNILICPLNWGLGHASRCVPVINQLLSAEANVIIAADKGPLAFLKLEFPDLEFIKFPAYEITYQKKGSLILKLIGMLPRILKGIYKEHQCLKEIIAKNNIDIVISDNRFGLWNPKVKSIFITHQIQIKSPVNSKIIDLMLFWVNSFFINKYDECWIPDLDGDINLSGDLSHKSKPSVASYFIGPLSRFKAEKENTTKKEIDLLIILSGPEPQRSIFEKLMLNQISESHFKTVLLRGVTDESDEIINKNSFITIYNHLPTEKMQEIIEKSDLIICRSGYSTIMDLAVFGKKAILIPTPGQTEQEYLGSFLMEKNYFYSISQKKFNLIDSVRLSVTYNAVKIQNDYVVLKERIISLLDS